MDSQTTPPKRSRLAPEPDYTAPAFLVPDRASSPAGSGTAEPTGRGAVLPAHRESAGPDDGRVQVIVTDVHISFWSMVELMVKLAFATIPAAIIITFCVLAAIAVASRLAGAR